MRFPVSPQELCAIGAQVDTSGSVWIGFITHEAGPEDPVVAVLFQPVFLGKVESLRRGRPVGSIMSWFGITRLELDGGRRRSVLYRRAEGLAVKVQVL